MGKLSLDCVVECYWTTEKEKGLISQAF